MDKEELDKKIEERKKQAEKKQIAFKGKMITCLLGHGPESEDYTDKTFENINCATHYFWKKSYVGTDCELNIDSGLGIQYRGKIVFQADFSYIVCYIPGDWEEEFEKLYSEAKMVAERKKEESKKEEKKSKDRRIKEGKKNWGF